MADATMKVSITDLPQFRRVVKAAGEVCVGWRSTEVGAMDFDDLVDALIAALQGLAKDAGVKPSTEPLPAVHEGGDGATRIQE